MRIFGCFCAALTLTVAAPGTTLLAQKKPEKIKLIGASENGAVLLRVPVAPFSYALQFSKNGNSGFCRASIS